MRRRSLRKDTRAAVYVEFLVVFMPVFTLWLGMTQIGMMYGADVIVQHAADAAVRSAVVVIPDDPARYRGPEETPKNQINWSDESGDSGTPTSIGGFEIGGALSFTGDPRLNTIRWAAYKPLLGIAPQPSHLGRGGAESVRAAIGDAQWRFLSGLVYNMTALSVTFPTAEGAGDVQVSGVQNFPGTPPPVRPVPITARVTYLYNCAVPFAAQLMCDSPLNISRQSPDGHHELQGAMFPIFGEGRGLFTAVASLTGACFQVLRAESTLIYQAAGYQYASEQGAEADTASGGGGSSSSPPPAPDCFESCRPVCNIGQPCGNTCINAAETCHVGRGSACHRSELCD